LQHASSVHGDKGDGKHRKKAKTWFVLSAVAFPFLYFDSYNFFSIGYSVFLYLFLCI
jgi:hypothetical protein